MPKSRVTIVGLGLIGSSIGLALKKAQLDIEIVGHDKESSAANRASKRGAVDRTEWNLINACDGAGLIILATPLDGIKQTIDALKNELPSGIIITDTATTKVPVMEWAKQLPAGVEFIGGDPILKPNRASDEADANLFAGATYCLTAAESASSSSIDTLTSMITLFGAKPYFIDAAEHDGLMAGVQHLPALLATALAAATMQSQGWRELSKIAGSDFKLATELVPPNGVIARDQFLAHRTDLIRWIDTMTTKLGELRKMCEHEDSAALETLVETLTAERESWLRGDGSGDGTPAPDRQSLQNATTRFFLGGMTERFKKSK